MNCLIVSLAVVLPGQQQGTIEVVRPILGTGIRPNGQINVGGTTTTVQGGGVVPILVEVMDSQGVLIPGGSVVTDTKPNSGAFGVIIPPPPAGPMGQPPAGWPTGTITVLVTNTHSGVTKPIPVSVVPHGQPLPPRPGSVKPPKPPPKNKKFTIGGQPPGGNSFAPGQVVTVAGTVDLEGATAQGEQVVFFELLDANEEIVESCCLAFAQQGIGETYSFSVNWTLPTTPGSYRLRLGSTLTDDDDLGTVTIVAP